VEKAKVEWEDNSALRTQDSELWREGGAGSKVEVKGKRLEVPGFDPASGLSPQSSDLFVTACWI
jgi:hypothetical protein